MGPVTRIVVQMGGCRLSLCGRQAWAMAALLDAGEGGCTPITHPGPRWSDYVFKLRRDGFVIESIEEQHGGCFSGKHVRYVLKSEVVELDRQHGEGGKRRAAA